MPKISANYSNTIIYKIVCKDIDEKSKIVQHLEENGIQTRNYFAGNILYHPAYEHLDDFRNYITSISIYFSQ